MALLETKLWDSTDGWVEIIGSTSATSFTEDLPGLAVFERPYRCIPKSPVLRGDPNVGGPVSRIPYGVA